MNDKEKIDVFFSALTPAEQDKLVEACAKIIDAAPKENRPVNLNIPVIMNEVRIQDQLKERKKIVGLTLMSMALSAYGLYQLVLPLVKKPEEEEDEPSFTRRWIIPASLIGVGVLGSMVALKKHSNNKKLLEYYSKKY